MRISISDVVQEWEGYVVEIEDTFFVANLLDLTAGASYAVEEVTIPLSKVSSDDISRMVTGSIFRWRIGYESSTNNLVSQIELCDMPIMAQVDFEKGRAWARGITRCLDESRIED